MDKIGAPRPPLLPRAPRPRYPPRLTPPPAPPAAAARQKKMCRQCPPRPPSPPPPSARGTRRLRRAPSPSASAPSRRRDLARHDVIGTAEARVRYVHTGCVLTPRTVGGALCARGARACAPRRSCPAASGGCVREEAAQPAHAEPLAVRPSSASRPPLALRRSASVPWQRRGPRPRLERGRGGFAPSAWSAMSAAGPLSAAIFVRRPRRPRQARRGRAGRIPEQRRTPRSTTTLRATNIGLHDEILERQDEQKEAA